MLTFLYHKKNIIFPMLVIILFACKPKPIDPEAEPQANDTTIIAGNGSTSAYINGTFIDFWNKTSWTDSQWDTHMQEMKEIGIKILFIQYTAYNEYLWTNSENTYSTIKYENALSNLFKSAEKNNIKVFTGLYFNENFWSNTTNTSELNIHVQRSKKLADDIWQAFKHNKAFAGWYISHEAAPYYYNSENNFNILKNNLINPLSSYCKEISDKPVTTTVFFNENLTDISTFRTFMKRMGSCNLDLILLQDGIGVNHCTVNNLDSYFQAANKGLYTDSNYEGAFWADIETFKPDNTPENFSTLKQKLDISANYVRRIITYQYYKDMCPTGPNSNSASVLRNDYINYLN